MVVLCQENNVRPNDSRDSNCLAVRSLQSIRGLGTTVLMCVFNVCITCFVIVVIYFSLFV